MRQTRIKVFSETFIDSMNLEIKEWVSALEELGYEVVSCETIAERPAYSGICTHEPRPFVTVRMEREASGSQEDR